MLIQDVNKKRKTGAFFLLKITAVVVLVYGCNSGSEDIEKKRVKLSYSAIHGSDTAILKLVITGSQFKGLYEVNYHGSFKDSGEVKGTIKGDTLIGDYHFQHYGLEKWRRAPIALLKKDGKLILGTGITENYFTISYFKTGEPIDYSQPKFIFRKTN
jgi:hypothetical protein